MSQVRPIEDLFGELIELETPDERRAYLDKECGEDEALRKQLQKLIEAHGKAGSFLRDEVETREFASSEQPGQMIGPYKLRERLGVGGMGIVWAAEQKEPIRRKVALKVIKPGMDSESVLARFEAERQALALMDHPNIARVLDAGATPQGRPYFVMELIRGVPITEYCDAHNLTIRERLDLFLQVCGAVQHAHQKGIIHRDIKPTNVLVTERDSQPVPKVIDFGINKALNQPLTDMSIYSGVFKAIGTVNYMSPEQAGLSSGDVDTRADVYGLGVLLYELITGVTPFDADELNQAAFDEACRIIREQEPPRPSTRLSTLGERVTNLSKVRSTDPTGLNKTVRGDLDWILLKALEKDRNRRYGTPVDFGDDIIRYLQSEPVTARRPSLPYVAAKFIRRNRSAVATSLLIFLTLLAASAISLSQAASASREAIRARVAEESAVAALTRAKAAEALATMEAARARLAEEKAIQALCDFANLDPQSQLVAAEQGLRELLQTREDLLGKDHNDTLRAKTRLAEFLLDKGEWREAGPLAIRAFRQQIERFGLVHENTKRSKELLARIIWKPIDDWWTRDVNSETIADMAPVVSEYLGLLEPFEDYYHESEALHALGVCQYFDGNYDVSLQTVRRSIELREGRGQNDLSTYWAALALLHCRLHQKQLGWGYAIALNLKWSRSKSPNLRPVDVWLEEFSDAYGGPAPKIAGVDSESLKNDLQRLIESQPNDAGLRIERAIFVAQQEEWPTAFDDISVAVELSPGSHSLRQLHAAAALAADQPAAYDAICADSYGRFRMHPHLQSRFNILKLCCLAPTDSIDLESLLNDAKWLTEKARAQNEDVERCQALQGIIACRSRQYAASLELLPTDFIHSSGMEDEEMTLLAGLFRAVALHRMGVPEKARTVLQQTCAEMERRYPAPQGPPSPWISLPRPLGWAVLNKVREEAESLVLESQLEELGS